MLPRESFFYRLVGLTVAPSSRQQGEQPPLEKMKLSRSRNLEEALSESDTLELTDQELFAEVGPCITVSVAEKPRTPMKSSKSEGQAMPSPR